MSCVQNPRQRENLNFPISLLGIFSIRKLWASYCGMLQLTLESTIDFGIYSNCHPPGKGEPSRVNI